jgi:hypothetical protein
MSILTDMVLQAGRLLAQLLLALAWFLFSAAVHNADCICLAVNFTRPSSGNPA